MQDPRLIWSQPVEIMVNGKKTTMQTSSWRFNPEMIAKQTLAGLSSRNLDDKGRVQKLKLVIQQAYEQGVIDTQKDQEYFEK